MLSTAKMGVLRLAETTGASRFLSESAWRRHRLLILAYHGISKYDEHQWGGLYMSPETFRQRMKFLEESRCNVLPLTEALHRLQNGNLPDRAVAITFDDGWHDFFSVATPILESFGYPVTLYLTTYYVEFNRPVFGPMCSYLLWKGGRHKRQLEWPDVLSSPVALDDASRNPTTAMIERFTNSFSGREKDDTLARLAERLDVDYEKLCEKRVLHLINPEEARELAARGVSLQYHTHRHRVYRDRERMFMELEDNRRRITQFTSDEPCHFCYTGGFYLPEYPRYLKEYGIVSATTGNAGLCTPQTDLRLLPRVVDKSSVSDLEFRSWLAGTADLLPKRATVIDKGQLLEVEEPALRDNVITR